MKDNHCIHSDLAILSDMTEKLGCTATKRSTPPGEEETDGELCSEFIPFRRAEVPDKWQNG